MFYSGLSSYLTDVLAHAPTGSDGLALAEEEIDGVIAAIEAEQAKLRPEHFDAAGRIAPSSFGSPDAAPNLAVHHTRAHEVVYKTLNGIKEDLAAFQQACRDAKNEIIAADEESADRMRVTQNAVEALAHGATSRHAARDHQRAQQEQDVTGGVVD